MTTGMRIAKLRTKMGWSQSKLAREIKTNVSTIQKWENDISSPRARHIKELSKIFGVTSDYILALDDKKVIFVDDLSENQIELLERVRQAITQLKPV